MENFTDQYICSCPYCGSTEMIETLQSGYAAIYAADHQIGGDSLYHTVCRNCGTVLRSYVKEPELLLKRSERRQVEEGEGWKARALQNRVSAIALVLAILLVCAGISLLPIAFLDGLNSWVVFICIDCVLASAACFVWYARTVKKDKKDR